MERMAWVAELFDRISGPAKRMSRSLWDFYAVAHQGRNQLGQFGEKAKTVQDHVQALQGPLGYAAAGILAAGTATAFFGYKLGEAAFSQFAFKEASLATGKALWGSAEAADAMFKKASQLARLTPFNVGEVVTGFNKLGAAGFKMEEVPVVMQGLSDIAAMSGKGSEAIGSLTLAFSQIMGKGHLAGQELNQITEAAGGAVSRLKLFKEIANIMHVDEKSIDSMMQNGLVPAKVAIMGVMQVAKQLGGGIIGQNSIEQSKTLGGLWSNLQDTITNLWLTMDLSKAPWFAAVKRFMTGLIDALDTASTSGRHLQQVFERVFGKWIGEWIGDGTRDMGQFVIKLADGFEYVSDLAQAAFGGMWEGLKAVFGPVLDGFDAVSSRQGMLDATRKTFEKIGEAVGAIASGLATIAALISGVSNAFNFIDEQNKRFGLDENPLLAGWDRGDWSKMSMPIEDGFQNAIDTAKEVLGIHSPSTVFEELGQNTVQGFNRGVERTPGMDSTLAADLATGAAGRGMGSGTGGGVSVALTVQVNATGGADGDSIAQRLSEILPSAVASLFDQVATEQGLTA